MKKIVSMLLCIVFLCSGIHVIASEAEGFNGVKYEVKNGSVIITGYTDELQYNVFIPAMVEDKPVTEIADFAFEEATMRSIKIPKGIKLGKAAFYKCKDMLLIRVYDPQTEETIASDKCLLLDDGKTLYFQSPTVPHSLVMPYVENIEFAAAMYVRAEAISFPSVKTIGEQSFVEAKADSVHFMKAQNIGKEAFRDAIINKAYFIDVKKIDEYAFQNAKIDLYFYCDAPEIAENAFDNAYCRIFYAKGTSGWDELNLNTQEFEPKQYKAKFYVWYDDIGQAEEPFATVELYEGQTLTPDVIPAFPEIEGYVFDRNEESYMPAFSDFSSFVYYNKYVLCHLKFTDGLTHEIIQEYDSPKGTTAEFPEVPVHVGYSFKGWVPDSDLVDQNGVRSTDLRFVIEYDLAYTATYEAIKYYVDFIDSLHPSAYTNPEEAQINGTWVNYGQDVPESAFPTPPEHKGYTFIGWSDDGKNVTEDRLIYALYDASIGDANTDGEVNTADAVYILKFSANMIGLSDAQKICADTNKDGKVNTADAVLILKYAAGMITSF